MKRFLSLMFAALALGTSTTLIAGSIVINSQPAQAYVPREEPTYRIDDPTPRLYPTDSPKTHAGQPRIDANS